jgi:hypothetical protein
MTMIMIQLNLHMVLLLHCVYSKHIFYFNISSDVNLMEK